MSLLGRQRQWNDRLKSTSFACWRRYWLRPKQRLAARRRCTLRSAVEHALLAEHLAWSRRARSEHSMKRLAVECRCTELVATSIRRLKVRVDDRGSLRGDQLMKHVTPDQ